MSEFEELDEEALIEEIKKENLARAGECFSPRFILTTSGSPFLVLMFVIGSSCEICVGQLSCFDPNKGGDIPANWAQSLIAPSTEQMEFLKTNKVPYFKPIFS